MTYIVALAMLAVLLYIGACAWLPFAPCSRCHGAGVVIGKTRVLRRPVGKPCRWCRQSGRRLRWGRRVWNRFARIRQAANR